MYLLFLRMHLDCNRDIVLKYFKRSKYFLKTYSSFNWLLISKHEELSENFIREFQNRVQWFFISERQKLSEDFIREFQDRVFWPNISCRFESLSLSTAFLFEFEDTIYWESINKRRNYSEEYLDTCALKM